MAKIFQTITWIFFVSCFFAHDQVEAIWSSPVTMSSPPSSQAQIGVDADGNAVAIWQASDGINSYIQSATLVPGASWSAPTNISTVQVGNNHSQSDPQVAVASYGSGLSVAVWEEFNGSTSIIKASTLIPGKKWISPVPLCIPTASRLQTPQVAINSTGTAAAIWVRHNGFHNIIQATILPFGGTWSTPVDLSSLFIDAFNPQIGIDDGGNIVAVWENNTDQVIQAAILLSGGSWSSSMDISLSGQAFVPQLAVGPSGYAVLNWLNFNGFSFTIQAATLKLGGSWSTPVDISAAGTVNQHEIAVDILGNAVAVWSELVNNDVLIRAAYLPFGGAWSTPTSLSPTGASSFDPKVAFDPAGNAIAVWDRDSGYDLVIQTAMLPFGGSWSSPTNLSFGGQISDFPQIAISPSGYAVVNWTNETFAVIQAATWVPAPTVVSVAPNAGFTGGGNSVTITGTNFINVTSIEFGSSFAWTYTVVSSTTLIAMAPGQTAGAVDVTVSTLSGTSPINPNDQYTYVTQPSAPAVNRIQPRHGPTEGNNTVRIFGTNFVEVTKVAFGSVNALSYMVISPNLIIAIAPPGTGVVDITVTTFGGISPVVAGGSYTYMPSQ